MKDKNNSNENSADQSIGGEHRESQSDPLCAENYRAFYYHNPNAILVVMRNGEFISANPAGERLSGYTSDELIGKSFTILSPPCKQEENKEYFKQDFRGTRRDFETIMVRKDGQHRDISVTGVPLMNGESVIGSYAIIKDITESHNTERRLQKKQEDLELIFSAIPDLFFRLDRNGAIVDYHAGDETDLYVSTEEFMGKSLRDILPSDVAEEYDKAVLEAKRMDSSSVIRYSLEMDGFERCFEGRVLPHGEQAVILVRNITGNAEMQRVLKSQLAEIESVYENAPVGLSFVDTDLRYLRINNLLAKMHGRSAAEHIGNTVSKMIPELEDIVLPIYRQVIESGSPVLNVELSGTTKADPENTHCWVVSFFPTKSESGSVQGVVVSVQDITQLRQAYEMLQETEGRYKSLFENMQNGFALHEMVFDETGKPIDYIFLDVNEAFEKQTTLKRENIIGRKVTEVLPGIENDPADWIGTYGRVVLTGNSLSFENYSEPLKKWYSIVAYRPDDGLFAVVFIDITDHKRAEQENLDNQIQLKSLASELVLAEERERNRIAVHLHDNVSQSLAYAKMKLQVVNAALDDQALIKDMTEVCDILTRMMQEVHSLTFELSTPVLTELGLEKAISHWLQEQIEQKHGIDTEFTDDGQTKPLDDDVQALLFRSVRELLANTVKHSKASMVWISISRVEGQILIRLEDDGIGFAPGKVVVGKDVGGFGIFSIRERLIHLGGSLEMDSSPGQGCRSVLKAPLQQS
ncbi:PAS domain S-box protein [Planctomycetota bacterium]